MVGMAEQPKPIASAEPEGESRKDLALLVAALGGGPGDRRDSGVRRGADETFRAS